MNDPTYQEKKKEIEKAGIPLTIDLKKLFLRDEQLENMKFSRNI